jgi:hypothetical protein
MAIEEGHDKSPEQGEEQAMPHYEPPAVEDLAAPDGPAVTAAGVITTAHASAPRNV